MNTTLKINRPIQKKKKTNSISIQRKIIISLDKTIPPTTVRSAKLAHWQKPPLPSALLYFLHSSTRYCCFRQHNGISRLFADTNVRDHPSFVARARSRVCARFHASSIHTKPVPQPVSSSNQ